MRNFLAIVILALAATSAQAGDASCIGKIVVEGSQGKLIVARIHTAGYPDQPAYVCGTFAVASAIGRRILKTCPNGSTCMIDPGLPRSGIVPPPGGPFKRLIEITRETDDLEAEYR